MSRWTPAEVEKLRRHYVDMGRDDLVRMFRRKFSAIQVKASDLGLRKRRDWMEIVRAHQPTIFGARAQ